MTEEQPNWWPERENWPEFPMESFTGKDGHTDTYRPGAVEALALLLLEEYVVPLNGAPEVKGGRCGLFVHIDDMLEPLPIVGTANDRDFWSLYDIVRAYGLKGAVLWLAVRRTTKPAKKWCDMLREANLWSENLEALP